MSSTHDTKVGWQPGPGGTGAYWAYCSCGWSARGTYFTRGQAQQDADDHAAHCLQQQQREGENQ